MPKQWAGPTYLRGFVRRLRRIRGPTVKPTDAQGFDCSDELRWDKSA